MTGVPIGIVVALIDAASQASGQGSVIDRADEKLVRYIRSSGSGGRDVDSGYRPPPSWQSRRRSPSKSPSRARTGPKRRSGYYWSHKKRRWLKSKFKPRRRTRKYRR